MIMSVFNFDLKSQLKSQLAFSGYGRVPNAMMNIPLKLRLLIYRVYYGITILLILCEMHRLAHPFLGFRRLLM